MRKMTDRERKNVPMQFLVQKKGDRKRYHAAAKKRGITLSAWIRGLMEADIAKMETGE